MANFGLLWSSFTATSYSDASEQFFEVFRRYNETVWPAQWVFYALALVAIAVAWRGRTPSTGRIVSGILALLWLWMGVVYHLMFFRSINPLAILFGVLFIVQAVLFAWIGVWRTHLASALGSTGPA